MTDAETEKYVSGLLECAKCNFTLISNTLYMKSGTIGPNNKSDHCPNGCGPLWKVSYKDYVTTLGDRLDDMHDKSVKLVDALEQLSKNSECGCHPYCRCLEAESLIVDRDVRMDLATEALAEYRGDK